MKKYALLLVAFLFIAFASQAQDVITLTNGSTIQAKVLQIDPSQITYKDFNNLDGPTITILKAGVVSIVYANGTKTVFSTDGDNKPASGSFTRSSSSGHYTNGDNSRGYKRKSGRRSQVKGWYFGAALAEGLADVTNQDPTYSTNGGGYSSINLLASYMFSQHLGIQFGLGFDASNYGVNYNASNPYAFESDDYSLSYFTIPVRALYLSNSKGRVGFYANVGVDLSLREISTDNEQDNLNSYYSTALISPYVSCGVDLRSGRGGGIWMLGPFYKTSVTNLYSGSQYDGYMNSGNSGNISSIGLTISYMAHFGR